MVITDILKPLLLFTCAQNGHVDTLRYAIANGAVCDIRALLDSPGVQSENVVQYLRTVLDDVQRARRGNFNEAPLRHRDADPADRLRRAQTAIDDVSEHIPEGTYLETMNALGAAHRRVRPRRDDD